MQRFRSGLVSKAHRLVYHSTLGVRVINKKKKTCRGVRGSSGKSSVHCRAKSPLSIRPPACCSTTAARCRPWVVRVRYDDGELRLRHYIYAISIESRLIMRANPTRFIFVYDRSRLGFSVQGHGCSPRSIRPPRMLEHHRRALPIASGRVFRTNARAQRN